MPSIESPDPSEIARPTSSRRDPGWLRDRLDDWLPATVGGPATITRLEIPSANGMSSETIVLDAQWSGSAHELVVRVAPLPQSDPVFPTYDLDRQFRIIEHVAATTGAAVPPLYWSEPDPEPLGAPFFVMGRIDGLVPPDVMPYTFGSWLTEADDDQRRTLTETTIATVAMIHSAPVPKESLDLPCPGETPLAAHVRRLREFYTWSSAGRAGSPLIERGFDWAMAHLPDESDPVLTWGDARIGNVIYRDFTPTAVLDWEMAAYGPRELDVAWLIFLHRFFQDLTEMAGMPGLPDFLARDDVAATYTRVSGHELRDLDFYLTYAALIHAVVMFRIQSRAIHFGQAEQPDDTDDMIMHRATLEAMLAGTYWENVR
ncbi:MAG: phosphotransferase family protein [Gordonia sp.]|uniref:phosphotransferase family protein n=1 Tax=Gordonia sp. (in: high G+C Gram-positive bacteria) TaxID=84139 RepID=UPI000C60E816|nr:phosphotransferase family protein [Gordonia sp. (in: high G+C Gram-positive bacteria)]MAU80507.1 phosphotransferase family protein [Gordonia sp. (in: high G+C Gram-positive bacteria)]